jgi:hypothetical protein
MGISNRHLDRFVSHQLLHCPKVNPSHHEPTGKRVAQTVPGEIFDSSFDDRWLKPVTRPHQGSATTMAHE